MKPMDGMLFDLGETILMEDPPDFSAGIRMLVERAENPRGVTLEEIERHHQTLREEFLSRRESSMLEFTCQAYQRILHDRFGLRFREDPLTLERMFRETAFKTWPAEDIKKVFDTLETRGVRIAILSNSIFAESTLRWNLSRHGLEDRFEFIISTADYGLRKPHPEIFQTAAGMLDLPPERIWFAGDKLEYDARGANEVGMTSVWCNWDRREPINGVKANVEIHHWSEFLDLLESMG